MKHLIGLILLFLLFSLLQSFAHHFPTQREFENISNGGELVNCFFQDDKGIIWAGTHDGLYTCHNNRQRKMHINGMATINSQVIYCAAPKSENTFYIGTGNGLYILNLKENVAQLIPGTEQYDIRSMLAPNKRDLLLGTMNGLILLDLLTGEATKVTNIPDYPIYSLHFTDTETIYVSSYKEIYKYNTVNQKTEARALPLRQSSSALVLSMKYDPEAHCLWVGTETDLFKFDLTTERFHSLPSSGSNSFKTIELGNDGNLWLGTDNGLYIYNKATGIQEYYVHSSKNDRSLINNIIWTIFEDKEQNIWLGTDCGISLFRKRTSFQIYRWEDIAHTDEGNRITCIFRDSKDNYWFGGTNGLGRFNQRENTAIWYKMSNTEAYIAHNRIRSIHEDKDGDLWVATDGSINRFDYTRNRFIQYTIMDSTQTRNANWSYSIFDDEQGRLWINAYLGGIFVVDKQKLLAHEKNTYLAEINYHATKQKNGLSSNRVQHAIQGKEGSVWVSTSREGLNKISSDEKNVIHFTQGESANSLSNDEISCLFCDSQGYIWVGLRGALNRIDPNTNEVIHLQDNMMRNKPILSILEKGNYLWLTVSDGLFALNRQTQQIRYITIDNLNYTCSFSDQESGNIWIGGIDCFISFNSDTILDKSRKQQEAVLTELYVNDECINAGNSYDKNIILPYNLPYTESIRLNHNQNNLAFELSNGSYNLSIQTRFLYKLSDIDKDWRTLDDLSQRISYSNLPPGDYTLQIKKRDNEAEKSTIQKLKIHILSPWYLGIWAKASYCTLFLGLLIWTINYFRVKNNLRIERIEKEKVLELTNMKMEFLTNISHELKTPLSLIISPVNKLISLTKNAQTKQLLQYIQQNAMRLSLLVRQIIDIQNLDHLHSDLSLSKLEIVEFIRSIIDVYRENCREKNITLQFHTTIPQLYMKVDILKMEPVINNLIANACKFTLENGMINVELLYSETEEQEGLLTIIIADSGVGIPERDIPFIFDRFFQSSQNIEMNKEGSGIGLSLVRKYVDLHGGHIQAKSEEGKGTTMTVTLPVNETPIEQINEEEVITSEDENQLKVLVVEDNVEIARFIKENLKNSICTVTHNGRAGYEQAILLLPDIIIADVMMPVMDGIEMSRLLKQNIKTATIPIILLTAKDDKRTEMEAFSVGVEAFIPKPFDMKFLIARMNQISQNKSLLVTKLRQASIIEEKEVNAQSQDEKMLIKITEIIEERLSDPDLTVSKVSQLSGINTKQIYRRIKLLTGHTVVDYIKSIRLKKAAMLLKQNKFTVGEVMYMVGFSNHSYFAKCFTEKYGKTPKQYMEENKQS